MTSSIKLLVAQINPTVGNIRANAEQILSIIHTHAKEHDVILFPELILSGYPPEDLLFKDAFHQQIEYQLEHIKQATPDCHVIIGHPERHPQALFNAASVFYQGKKLAHYHKQELPNNGVFDEKRYFTPGEKRPCILTIKGMRFGVCICEDIWQRAPIKQLEHAEIHCLLSLNASPFDTRKYEQRRTLLNTLTQKGFAVVYANLVGGQDELIFDGQSLVLNAEGEVLAHGMAFESEVLSVSLTLPPRSLGLGSTKNHLLGQNPTHFPKPDDPILLYNALVMATRDYLSKHHFKGALVGLSGGIDSALTLAIACDALGAANVTAVKMPSCYTQPMSIEDADFQIHALQVNHHTLSIDPVYQTYLTMLHPIFDKLAPDVTEENIQARIRGLLLMAISNKHHLLVLTTTNKSELAMGYGTLYGDLAGGFAVLKDLYKTEVYALARYRNSLTPIIPDRVFTRPPSAELAPNQTDQDTLPPYERLDPLIRAYVEHNQTLLQLIEQGFNAEEVHFVISRIHSQEYKRKQAPVGPKLTPCAFGKDWRFPIS